MGIDDLSLIGLPEKKILLGVFRFVTWFGVLPVSDHSFMACCHSLLFQTAQARRQFFDSSFLSSCARFCSEVGWRSFFQGKVWIWSWGLKSIVAHQCFILCFMNGIELAHPATGKYGFWLPVNFSSNGKRLQTRKLLVRTLLFKNFQGESLQTLGKN